MKLARILAPSGHQYFDLFEAAGANTLRAAELLRRLLDTYPEHPEMVRQIVVCEQDGDQITHDLIQRLNHAFVAPIDRDDVYHLAAALDDIVDYTEEVADYLGLYNVEAPMEQAQALADLLLRACRQIALALPMLRSFGDVSEHAIEIHRLENEGDRVSREAIASLFDRGIDPMVVICWKDLFERLEDAIDATEDVANIIEGIVIKNH